MKSLETRHALEKAIGALIHQQRQDGSWPGYNVAGPAFTAMTLVVEGYLGALSRRDARQGIHSLRKAQLADGSFPSYPYATQGSLSATALAYAGLIMAGVQALDPILERAGAFIDRAGGFAGTDLPTQLFLALAGLWEPRKLGKAVLFFKLIPGNERLLGRRFGLEFVVGANQIPVIIRGLQSGPWGMRWWRPLQALERLLVLRYLTRRQNPQGNWAGVLMPTLFGLLCLHFLGVLRSDPRFYNALCYLKRWKVYDSQDLSVVPYVSEIWNTALTTRALMLAGLSSEHQAVAQGVRYLLTHQSEFPEPEDWQNPAPGAPRSGGWPYEAGNPLCSDCDTTGAVLWTLGLAAKQVESVEVEQKAERGLAWLLGMQNRDGGWASFAHGLRSKPPGPIFTKPLVFPRFSLLTLLRLFWNPPVELGDPATAGLTGRVLSGLAARGYSQDTPIVRKAIAFLKAQSANSGAWWGRWEVNYLAATGCVLNALKAVGEDMQAPYVQAAVNWMLAQKNPDGGWGEESDSYTDPAHAGVGPSRATITGQVLSALIDAGEADSEAVRRGIDYLLAAQNADGLWKDRQALFVMVPPNFFYTNAIYAQYAPVEALVKYTLHRHVL